MQLPQSARDKAALPWSPWHALARPCCLRLLLALIQLHTKPLSSVAHCAAPFKPACRP